MALVNWDWIQLWSAVHYLDEGKYPEVAQAIGAWYRQPEDFRLRMTER